MTIYHQVTLGGRIAGQFNNPADPPVHYLTTATEIWNDTDGDIDVLGGHRRYHHRRQR